MKYDYDFHESEWLWTLAIGVPFFGVAAWLGGNRAKSSPRWRVILCTLFAFIITPFVLFDDEGAPACPVIIDIVPAVMTLPLVVGAFPIGLVATLLARGWSAISPVARRIKH
jgi:hypothetical protein